MNPTYSVVVTSPSFSKSELLRAELEHLGVRAKYNEEGLRLAGDELVKFIHESGAPIAIVGLEKVGDRELDGCPGLKFVAKFGVGLDNIDQKALEKRGIGLGWAAGVNRRSVSELVLAFVLGHLRNAVPSIELMRRSKWVKNGGMQLSDATVGIVGFGHIGSDLALLLRGFGCRVLCTDILNKKELASSLGVRQVSYGELLKQSDVVTFHVPRTELTRGMFGTAQLGQVKPHALIVNTARGDIVEFERVCEAVVQGRLGGFAADVFPEEPCDLSAWSGADHLYFTPHIGGNAREAVLAMGRSAISHIARYLGAAKQEV